MILVRAVFVALILSVLLVPTAEARDAEPGVSLTYRLRTAVRHLTVQRQSHANSYDRDKDFGDWIEQGESCDTRAVVLQIESRVPVTQDENCIVKTGRWRSYYDATTYTDASDLQIDHVVPVKNVWVAGAWRWTRDTRVAYYNDLDDPRTLVAVDSHDNESKGDQTPDEWLPPNNHCRYIREFVSVKLRWRLTVTRAEKQALNSGAATCPYARIKYEPAPIMLR